MDIFKPKLDIDRVVEKCGHGYHHHKGPHACDFCCDGECMYWDSVERFEKTSVSNTDHLT